jgi:hypothetical protein
LDRTRPMLPMLQGQIERRTHDYQRHGATSLFAALNVKTGEMIGQLHRQQCTPEFRKFLGAIVATVPAQLDGYLILDTYGTHETAMIRQWLLKRPRFHLHFAPTNASWLNLQSPGLPCSSRNNCGAGCIAVHRHSNLLLDPTVRTRESCPSPSCGRRPPSTVVSRNVGLDERHIPTRVINVRPNHLAGCG